jgi:hypothetical protein
MDEKLAQCHLILIQVNYSLAMLQRFCWRKWDFIAWDVGCTPWFVLRIDSPYRQCSVDTTTDEEEIKGWLSYQILKEVSPLTTPFLTRSPNPLLHIAEVHWVPILSIVILTACGGTFRFPDPSVPLLKGKEAFASSISFAEFNSLTQTTKGHPV